MMRMIQMRYSPMRRAWAIVWLLWLAGTSVGAGFEPHLHAGAVLEWPASGPITLQTLMTLPQDPDGVEAVILAGLGEEANGLPGILALVWAESGGWLPAWELQIHSGHGLLEGRSLQSGGALGTVHTKVHDAWPQWGHTYATTFAYDPATGAISISIENRTLGRRLYQDQLAVAPFGDSVYPAHGIMYAGQAEPAQRYVGADGLSLQPVFIPAGVRWGVVTVDTEGRQSLPSTRISRQNTTAVGLRLELPAQAPGAFRFVLEPGDCVSIPEFSPPPPGEAPGCHDSRYLWRGEGYSARKADDHAGGERSELTRVENPEGTVFIPLPWDALPVGSFTLTMEYWDSGQMWLTESREIVTGRVDAHFSELRSGRGVPGAKGQVTLQADGTLPVMPVTVEAELFAQVWNAEVGRYEEVPWGRLPIFNERMALTDQPVAVPIHIPDPIGHPALWRVRFSTVLGTGVAIVQSGTDQSFATYPPGEWPHLTEAHGFPNPATVKGSSLNPADRRWERWYGEIAALERRIPRNTTEQRPIVFIGSSSIRGWGTLARDFPGLNVVNHGFGGSHIVDSTYFVDELVIPLAPEAVVMFAGSNDIHENKPPSQLLADYHAFVQRVHAALPETKIYFISISSSPSRWSQRDRVRVANWLIEGYSATDDRLEFIDVYHYMLGPDGTPLTDLYVSDMLHMSPAGYRLWSDILRLYLGGEDGLVGLGDVRHGVASVTVSPFLEGMRIAQRTAIDVTVTTKPAELPLDLVQVTLDGETIHLGQEHEFRLWLDEAPNASHFRELKIHIEAGEGSLTRTYRVW